MAVRLLTMNSVTTLMTSQHCRYGEEDESEYGGSMGEPAYPMVRCSSLSISQPPLATNSQRIRWYGALPSLAASPP